MADDSQNKETVEEKDTVEQESPNTGSEQTSDAGAEAQKPDNDYGMILDALKRLEDNQTRLAGQVAKISDAQSVLVDAGAIIHEDSADICDDATVDEFIPIDKLDLSL